MNPYPTQRQEQLMADVLRHPDDALGARAERVGGTRPGVFQVLQALERKGLAQRSAGKWSLTLEGRKWLRPTMGNR